MRNDKFVRLAALVSLALAACSGGSAAIDGEEDGGADAREDASRPVDDAGGGDAPDATVHDAQSGPDAAGSDGDSRAEADARHELDAAPDGRDAGEPTLDAGADSGRDAATHDAAYDAGHDGAVDASTPLDASVDARPDATDAAAPIDAAADTGSVDASVPDASDCNACPTACVNGACVGVCRPGSTRCTAHGPDYCSEVGKWRPHVGTCSAACMAPSGRYLVSSDGEAVEDTTTGLVWQRMQPPASNDWDQAVAYCGALDLRGLHWRLPTFAELEGLVIQGRCTPSIDQAAFPDCSTTGTWTSEKLPGGDVRVVDFALGVAATRPGAAAAPVRCVH